MLKGRGRCLQRSLPVFFMALWLALAFKAEAKRLDWQAELTKNQVPGAVFVQIAGPTSSAQIETYADPKRSDPAVTAATLVPLGRLSGLLNTALLLEGVQQGDWNLDENINTYLNRLQVVNPFSTPLTLRHLLLERDGFPEFYQGHWLENPKRVPSLEQLLNYGLKPLVKEPGSIATPGSWGAVLAAYLLEVQNPKIPADKRMQQRWGLASLKTGGSQTGVLQGTLLESQQLWNFPHLYSAAPASDQRLLSVADLQKWLEILVGKRPGLSPATRQLLFKLPAGDGESQSLGFLPYPASPPRGGPVYFRESTQMGLSQFWVVQPQTGKAAYLGLRREAPTLARQLLDSWLGIHPQPRQTPTHSEQFPPDGVYGYPHFHTQSLTALVRLNRGMLEVKTLANGDLSIASRGQDPFGGFGQNSIWEPIAAARFQLKGHSEQIAFVPLAGTVALNQPALMLKSFQGAGGAYLPIQTTARPPFQWALWGLFGLIFGLGFLRNLWQYWHATAPIEPEEQQESENAPPYLLMTLASGSGLGFLIGFPWVFFIEALPGEMSLAWRDPLNPWLFGLLVLPLLQLFFTGVSALLALGALRVWPKWDRLNGLLQLLATGGYVFWLQTWHLIGFQV